MGKVTLPKPKLVVEGRPAGYDLAALSEQPPAAEGRLAIKFGMTRLDQ